MKGSASRTSTSRKWSTIGFGILLCFAACATSQAGIAVPGSDSISAGPPSLSIDTNASQLPAPLAGNSSPSDVPDVALPQSTFGGIDLLQPRAPGDLSALDGLVTGDHPVQTGATPEEHDTSSDGGATSAIPLPPAIQTGLTGMAALGLAGLSKRIRRAFR
jgi:hypothetical protein